MPFLGGPIGGDSAVVDAATTNEKALGLILSLMPPGQLYDFENPESDVYKMFYAFAQAAKMFGYDVADRLVVEFNPATCLEKLSDWEGCLDIVPGTGNASAGRTTPQRRLAIVSKLRESGASTLSNIRSAIGPVLGYTNPALVEVMEVIRAALTALHTYSDATAHVIAAAASYTYSFTVSDDGYPLGGVQLALTATGSGLTILITSPTGGTKTFTPTSAITTGEIFYAASEFAGGLVTGVWTVKATNTSGASITTSNAGLFVEGVADGLGGGIFYWGIYADPALVNNPDYLGTLQSIRRISPAHAYGFLVLSKSPYPDETTGIHLAIPDECLPV